MYRDVINEIVTVMKEACAAARLAAKPENAGKSIVVLLPDTGDRYRGAPMFQK